MTIFFMYIAIFIIKIPRNTIFCLFVIYFNSEPEEITNLGWKKNLFT